METVLKADCRVLKKEQVKVSRKISSESNAHPHWTSAQTTLALRPLAVSAAKAVPATAREAVLLE